MPVRSGGRDAAKAKQQQESEALAKQEQKLIASDIKQGKFRACVVPCAYSVEEFLVGACVLPEHRFKVIKLAEEEVRMHSCTTCPAAAVAGLSCTPNTQMLISVRTNLATLPKGAVAAVDCGKGDSNPLRACFCTSGSSAFAVQHLCEVHQQTHQSTQSIQTQCMHSITRNPCSSLLPVFAFSPARPPLRPLPPPTASASLFVCSSCCRCCCAGWLWQLCHAQLCEAPDDNVLQARPTALHGHLWVSH